MPWTHSTGSCTLQGREPIKIISHYDGASDCLFGISWTGVKHVIDLLKDLKGPF